MTDFERGAILAREQLAGWAEAVHGSGRTIAFTNGCFDLIHSGHLASLTLAAATLGWVHMPGPPVEAAIEQTFVNRDAAATLKLGQARGIAMLVPALRHIGQAWHDGEVTISVEHRASAIAERM